MVSLVSSHPLPFPHKPINPSSQTHKPFSTNLTINAETEAAPHDTFIPQFNYSVWKKNEEPVKAPLVCFFGAAQREFIPIVRVSERQMDQDQYNTWKMMQWDPPEFARAPSGPSYNVAISHVRLGGRATFMGKVGGDEFGQELLIGLNQEGVDTEAVKISQGVKTGATYMKLKFTQKEDKKGEKLVAETVKPCAEDSFLESEINPDVLQKAEIFHFNAEALTTPSQHEALYKAINISKQSGSKIFFDPNLPLTLWKSRDETLNLIKPFWFQSEIIEVTRHELEFLLNEPYFIRKRTVPPEYYAETSDLMKHYHRDYYHYTREDLAPLWHEGIKLLIVTHATLRIHYYTQDFDGSVIGAEDVLLSAMTCDRSGSGDAIVAAVMRKLLVLPEMFNNQDLLERQLRFAISAGIIAQWTNGAVRGFPTESAAKNMKEQLYIPSLW